MSALPRGDLVNALDAPAESLRLVAQWRDALASEGNPWAGFYADRVRRKIEDGSFQGRLWFGSGDEVVALVGWEVAGDVGRRGWLYLAEGFRTAVVLEGLLQRLDAPSENSLPFVGWQDDIPGVSEADRQSIFVGRGFSPVVRADMRFPKTATLPPPTPGSGHSPRTLKLEDEPLIADLLYRTYANSPERALFATTLDQREDARRGTHGLLHGEVGRWLPDASYGIEERGRLIAQTLANDLEGGLITEVGVDPAHRRQGLARRLLPLTLEALRSAGFEVPRLVVTMWNPGAVRLYGSLGFEFIPGGSGRVWLNLPALGVQAPGPAERDGRTERL
jgi:ribosomal protein S18 acetylase RimI-like enzyme